MPKLPKKHESHKNPGIAYRQLREMFGDGWQFTDPRDIDSGIEYGQDYMIEIVLDDGTLTGQEFRVQSKVVTKKSSFTRNGIGESIETSTLNYWLELPVPVLIHFIDGRTNNHHGYVMWLDEWLANNPRKTWNNQESKKVNIPLKNYFDETMVSHIVQTVEDFYFRHNIRKRADHINKYRNDHFIEVKVDHDSKVVTSIIHAKHKEAISHITPLDEEAAKAIRESIEFGTVTDITGRFSITNVPVSLFDDPSNIEIIGGKIIPNLKDLPSHFVRIKFYSSDDQVLYSKFLEFKPDQMGAKIAKWSTFIINPILGCVVTYNVEAKTLNWKFESELEETKKYNPKVLLEYEQFWDIYANAKSIEIELLEENHISRVELNKNNSLKGDKLYRQALKNLVLIMSICNLEITSPPQLTIEEIKYIDDIANIVSSGTLDFLIAPEAMNEEMRVSIEIDRDIATQYLKLLSENDPNSFIRRYSEQTFAEFLGVRFDMGASDLIFEDVKLENSESVYRDLENNLETIRMVFDFDKEKSYTRFPKWLKSENEIEVDKDNTPRKPGTAEGKIQMSNDFDEPLDDFNEYM